MDSTPPATPGQGFFYPSGYFLKIMKLIPVIPVIKDIEQALISVSGNR